MSEDSHGVRLRPARPGDATAVRDIYAPFVRDSPATFRTEVPSVEHVADEIREKRATDEFPWYVAVAGSPEHGSEHSTDDSDANGVVGYAYGSRLRDRGAYRWAVETSIYVDPDAHRGGIGTALYDRLLDTLRRQGYCGVYAALGMPNPESEAFHERYDFERIGAFPAAGFKLGDWHDVVWYYRRLRDPDGEPEEPRPVSAVDTAFADG
ncbi:GNAT family N-acetyltransferase [Halobellus limi]|uniref:N-acetyltransferase n=1 Tax=Halobellus limi TaxID=699433 RepID=A0A1H5Z6T6_9EURY|nr:GNAT family N-acetyltransferase [Halobellus limi]QCC48221.1 N-acetyltransferase [Halobellus limi]SEG31355.1 phosphinothricin acetyltransferase [Halobellus limi]